MRAIVFFDHLRAVARRGAARSQARLDGKPRNLLVIKLVGLGDTVLMLTPLARLRRERPEIKITAMVTPLSVGIISTQPSVDEIIVYDVLGKDKGIPNLLGIVRMLRARRFDSVIDFEQHFQMTALICYLTGAAKRVGFYYAGSPRKGLFSDPVFLDPDGHMVDGYMALIRPFGIEAGRVTELENISIPADDLRSIDKWLQDHGIGSYDLLVGIHSGSGIRATVRRWGIERFAELIRRLRRSHGAKIVLTGSAEERERVREIIEHAGSDGVYSASGELSILQSVALMKRCNLFISNDTGPLHMSAAVGTPTIGLFGPNSPIRYAPVGRHNTSLYRNVHCSPCIQIHEGKVETCDTGICMKEITVDEVWDAVQQYHPGPGQYHPADRKAHGACLARSAALGVGQ